MNLIAIVCILITGFISSSLCYMKTKRVLNCGSFYCYLWTAVGIMSNSGFMGYYLPSTLINTCICCSMLIFGIIYSIKGVSKESEIKVLLEADMSVRIKLITACNVLVFVYMIPFFIRALTVIGNQGLIYLRMISGSESSELGTTDISNLILQSICYPIILSSIFIGIVCLFLKNKKAIKILIIALMNLCIYCFTNASRNGFVIVIIVAVVAYFKLVFPLRTKKLKREGRSHKFLLSLISVALILVVVYISKERSSSRLSAFENVYIYFFGGPSYVTQLMKNMSNYSINHTFLYGTATFGFIYNIFAIIGRYFGIDIPISDYIINSELASKVYAISPTVQANAMSTVFFPFLMDWGYAGVIVGPLLMSLFVVDVERKSMTSGDVRGMTLGVYIYYFLYRSIFKYDGVSISFFFLLFFILLFTSTDSNRKLVFGNRTII